MTTLKVYAHFLVDADREAAKQLGDIFAPAVDGLAPGPVLVGGLGLTRFDGHPR